ncbi:hypothetical protein EROM_010300 [Encephalitozoon romaleae SJ-2008]|uniref:Uncharacterized protein n=1 Tax=Encephalitozoon romaleae (strain SJ-2008) TaxID=1178016 RepID=I7ACR5_ENCRO|nr:hypothetical protein EROM_010300 [Encephalitozoon romaleae SJ-2008]AFN82375.1 hypothetical protein EROM_010300 [Encephalitozoon romaleae SJ-2008]
MEKSLRKVIFEEYMNYIKVESCRPKLSSSGPFFSLNRYDLSGEKVRVFSIELTGVEFYVIDGYILLYQGNMVGIYRYDKRFKCTKIRSINLHLLLFLLRKKAMSRRCRFLFYNILLHLVKNNEKKYDMKLREIMCYLCADWMTDVKLGDGVVSCTYRNGESRVYNGRLQLIKSSPSWRKDKSTMECGDQKVRVMKNCVEVTRNDWQLKSMFPVGEIRQYIALRSNLFLLTEDSIKVLSFEE